MFVRRDLTDFVPTPEGRIHFVKQGSGYPLVMLHPLGNDLLGIQASGDGI